MVLDEASWRQLASSHEHADLLNELGGVGEEHPFRHCYPGRKGLRRELAIKTLVSPQSREVAPLPNLPRVFSCVEYDISFRLDPTDFVDRFLNSDYWSKLAGLPRSAMVGRRGSDFNSLVGFRFEEFVPRPLVVEIRELSLYRYGDPDFATWIAGRNEFDVMERTAYVTLIRASPRTTWEYFKASGEDAWVVKRLGSPQDVSDGEVLTAEWDGRKTALRVGEVSCFGTAASRQSLHECNWILVEGLSRVTIGQPLERGTGLVRVMADEKR